MWHNNFVTLAQDVIKMITKLEWRILYNSTLYMGLGSQMKDFIG